MTKYFVYHCSVSEIDTEENTVTSVLEAHTDDSRVNLSKEECIHELRHIIDSHSNKSLSSEINRLNRVVAVLDAQVKNALTIPV